MTDQPATPDPSLLEDARDLIEQYLEPDDYPRPGGLGGGSTGEALEAWRIDGENTATWAHAKLTKALRRREQAHATGNELARIALEHVERVERETAHDVNFFETKLRQYLEGEIAGTKKRSTKIPTATLKLTKGGVTTRYDDEAAVLAWAEDHDPDLIEYHDPTVPKAAVKKAYDGKVDDDPGEYPAVDVETGEIVPGVTFVRGPETFAVVPIEPDPEDG